MIGQCLRAWVSYVYVRRVKHQMRGVAGEHHNLVLATRTFGHWKQQYTQARQLADFEELVSIKGRLATLRRAVGAWKLCILPYLHVKSTVLYMCVMSYVHIRP